MRSGTFFHFGLRSRFAIRSPRVAAAIGSGYRPSAGRYYRAWLQAEVQPEEG
jgi:hypothetical protein